MLIHVQFSASYFPSSDTTITSYFDSCSIFNIRYHYFGAHISAIFSSREPYITFSTIDFHSFISRFPLFAWLRSSIVFCLCQRPPPPRYRLRSIYRTKCVIKLGGNNHRRYRRQKKQMHRGTELSRLRKYDEVSKISHIPIFLWVLGRGFIYSRRWIRFWIQWWFCQIYFAWDQ